MLFVVHQPPAGLYCFIKFCKISCDSFSSIYWLLHNISNQLVQQHHVYLLLQAFDSVSVRSLSGAQSSLNVSEAGPQSLRLPLGLVTLPRLSLTQAVRLLHLSHLSLVKKHTHTHTEVEKTNVNAIVKYFSVYAFQNDCAVICLYGSMRRLHFARSIQKGLQQHTGVKLILQRQRISLIMFRKNIYLSLESFRNFGEKSIFMTQDAKQTTSGCLNYWK